MTDNWVSEYEAAFLAANGKPAQIAEGPKGWYRVYVDASWGCTKYRRSSLERMAATLRKRAALAALTDIAERNTATSPEPPK